MKTKKIPLIALSAAAVALGAGATDVTIEGQWLVGGTVQRSAASDCSLNVYGAEGASSALWTTNGVPFVTDANGCFVVCVSTPAHLALPDTFWVGVAPAGQGEISPRFRIAPVPFAFAADEVQLVSAERNIELTGIATVDHLAVSGNVKTKDFVVATNSVLRAKNLQLDSAKIVSLDVPNAGMLGLFNAKGATPSFDCDAFSAEKSAFAQVVRFGHAGDVSFVRFRRTPDGRAQVRCEEMPRPAHDGPRRRYDHRRPDGRIDKRRRGQAVHDHTVPRGRDRVNRSEGHRPLEFRVDLGR